MGVSRAANTLATLSHEIPTALLPSLVTNTLGASAAAVGVIEGVADGMASVARLSGGAFAADPAVRRRTSLIGYTGTAVFSALLGVTGAAWQVGAARTAAWAFRGLRTPGRYVGVAQRTVAARLGRAYGAERAAEHLGAVGGPLLALLLLSLVGLRTAILLSIIPGLLAVAAIVYATRGAVRSADPERLGLRVRSLLRGRLGWTFAAIGAFECGNLAVTLLILRSTSLLTPEFGHFDATRVTLLLYALYRLSAAVICLPAGRLVDRVGPSRPLGAGAAVLLMAYVGFAYAPADVVALGICFALAGAAVGVVETTEHTVVALRSPAEVLPSAFGLLAALQGLGKLTSGLIAGVLWVLVAPAAGLLWAAPVVVLCFYCLFRGRTRSASAR